VRFSRITSRAEVATASVGHVREVPISNSEKGCILLMANTFPIGQVQIEHLLKKNPSKSMLAGGLMHRSKMYLSR
jgi:hypothetical protein